MKMNKFNQTQGAAVNEAGRESAGPECGKVYPRLANIKSAIIPSMNDKSFIRKQDEPLGEFDLFRLSGSKQTVDISSNTLRSYHAAGLPFYKIGKSVFVSRSELNAFIRARAASVASRKGDV